MDDSEFEGTLVLEKIAAIGKVEEFFEAIDADDFAAVKKLLQLARVEPSEIASVLKKMADPD